MKKRIIAGITAALLVSVLALAACGKSGDTPKPQGGTTGSGTVTPAGSGTSSGSGSASAKPVLGGWTINDVIVTSVLTEEAQEAFDKAIVGYTGVGLEPAALLATQVVSGTNYLYLCEGKTVTADPVPGWYLVVVYNDLEGNAEITSVESIDLLNLMTTESGLPSDVVGGWTLMPPADAVTLPQDVATKFAEATQAYTGLNLYPLALLGTQIVSGTNYMILCEGTTVTAQPESGIYVVKMYVDLSGKAEITDVQQLDLLAYLK